MIHDDEREKDVSPLKGDNLMENYENGDQENQDTDEDGYSESSDEPTDVSVQDDMEKFQNTIKGIKNRYRLIKRIGEGEGS